VTTTATAANVTDQPGAPCGPDCIYLDGGCRCYDSAPAIGKPAWMAALSPPF
jgi:hypothetical protein